MALKDFMKSQFIEVVEWLDDSSDTMVHRFPVQGQEIKMGAQLTVREGQSVIFVNEGKIADVFAPGRHKLSTRNLPILTKLMAWKHGFNPNRKIFEARKRETAALGAGEKLVLGHPLAATIGDSARCMQNLEKVLFTGPKTSDTVTFICD